MMKLLIFYMVQKKGSETIALKEGTSRIKLVGKNANGKIRIILSFFFPSAIE